MPPLSHASALLRHTRHAMRAILRRLMFYADAAMLRAAALFSPLPTVCHFAPIAATLMIRYAAISLRQIYAILPRACHDISPMRREPPRIMVT